LPAEQVAEALRTAPSVPTNLAQTDIPVRSLMSLLLKFMHLEACETLLDLAERLKIPRLVIQQLLDEAVGQKFMQAIGAVPGSLGLSIRYSLTEAGRAAAKEAMEQNLYMGPAPVSLAAYQAQIGRQRISNEKLDSEALNKGFEGLVVPDHYIRKLLPAVNAGRSVLLFGPPGNGKTTLATPSRRYSRMSFTSRMRSRSAAKSSRSSTRRCTSPRFRKTRQPRTPGSEWRRRSSISAGSPASARSRSPAAR